MGLIRKQVMPYIFAALIVINLVLLGYFVMFNNPIHDSAADKEASSLVKKIPFKNSSQKIPPLIGEK